MSHSTDVHQLTQVNLLSIADTMDIYNTMVEFLAFTHHQANENKPSLLINALLTERAQDKETPLVTLCLEHLSALDFSLEADDTIDFHIFDPYAMQQASLVHRIETAQSELPFSQKAILKPLLNELPDEKDGEHHCEAALFFIIQVLMLSGTANNDDTTTQVS